MLSILDYVIVIKKTRKKKQKLVPARAVSVFLGQLLPKNICSDKD